MANGFPRATAEELLDELEEIGMLPPETEKSKEAQAKCDWYVDPDYEWEKE